ncbi:hypothetical protein [Streptomyces sp. NBC_01800]|uniref:hypothetical protein n=1 Tax=Streptomyces sp. NBC_01800 TaxID=2975945 RepID=UPI002DD9A93F|nr:hypothetical protein [Streptomyces sp. NBC_01800]WSA68812.1 hypothetical protein OIE65_18500 [Streptomyces sp. NBC_01800]
MPEKAFLAGRQEFAALYGVKGPQVTQWLTRGALNYDHAVIVSGSPYWLLSFVRGFGKTRPRPRELDQAVLRQIVAEQEPGVWAQTVAEVPPLLGLQEATQLFGVASQQSMAAMVRKGPFTVPADYQLSGSKLWLLDTLIEAAPEMQAKSRTLPWAINTQVAAALRQGRYTGPGSVIVPRGPSAAKAA